MSNLFWSHRSGPLGFAIDAIDAVGAAATMPPGSMPMSSPSVPMQRTEPDAQAANERLDQLLLMCAAMWELLRERTQLTENDLVAKVAEVDARDGTADGKITYHPMKCPKCARTIFPKHRRCLYCGAEIPIDSVFKTI